MKILIIDVEKKYTDVINAIIHPEIPEISIDVKQTFPVNNNYDVIFMDTKKLDQEFFERLLRFLIKKKDKK